MLRIIVRQHRYKLNSKIGGSRVGSTSFFGLNTCDGYIIYESNYKT